MMIHCTRQASLSGTAFPPTSAAVDYAIQGELFTFVQILSTDMVPVCLILPEPSVKTANSLSLLS